MALGRREPSPAADLRAWRGLLGRLLALSAPLAALGGPGLRSRGEAWKPGRSGCEEEPASGRCLPNFLLIGAQKSGSSSLFELMRLHPQILEPRTKELHFFFTMDRINSCDPPWDRPTQQELTHYAENGDFPHRAKLENRSAVTGEWSVTYLACWCCPWAIARVLPRVRLIVQLRDPIARAHSRFSELHQTFTSARLEGREIPYYGTVSSMGFDSWATMEIPKLLRCINESQPLMRRVRCMAGSPLFGWSLYDLQLSLWLQYFDHRSLLVTYLDDLASQPLGVMRAIETHLGLEPHGYDGRLHEAFNTRWNYGWGRRAAGHHVADLPANASAAATVAVTTAAAATRTEEGGTEPCLGGAVSRRCTRLGVNLLVCVLLCRLYRPHLLELKRMADQGLITKLPDSWVKSWNLY